MKLSTRSKYALEALLYLATKPQDVPTSLSEIATNRNLSIKYLEQIFSVLKDAGILMSTRGKQGGYRYAVPTDAITAFEVVAPLEPRWQTHHSMQESHSIADTFFGGIQDEIILVFQHYTMAQLASIYYDTIQQDFVI